jgi:dCTP diphosphatase
MIRSKQTLREVIADIPIVAKDIATFAEDRLWTQYHTPRNLVLALLGEVGELAELLQFKGDDGTSVSNHNNNCDDPTATKTNGFNIQELGDMEMDKLSQELADVSIYLLRLTYVCNIVTPVCDELSKR